MNANLHHVIGIDLGTTYSAVAAYNPYTQVTELILNRADGNTPTTPSVISRDPLLHKAIVGRAAKNNLPNDPQNTILEIKREMGAEFSEETLGKFSARGIFNIGDPVKAYFEGQWLHPQEISAFTLMRMKAIAEEEIGEEIRDAVVTVPAYFTEKQRNATREAALLAGLYPRQLIPEPTAAAICYGVDQQAQEKRRYLVYDLGGGTFDVSIIEVEGQNIEVIATDGDMRLGGGDFDDAITEWAFAQITAAPYNVRVADPRRTKARIKLAAEKAKIILSANPETKLIPDSSSGESLPILTLTQEALLKLIDPYLTRSLNFVDRAINKAEAKKGVRREDIHAILLVGGSSKIPKVKTLLLDYFKKEESFVSADADPDAVVARGAAILARQFAPSPPPFDIRKPLDGGLASTAIEDRVTIRLITEHSLGVAVQDGRFVKVVDQGTNIPVSITDSNYTNAGPTDFIVVEIYQGEGEYYRDNTRIGTVKLGPMEPREQGFHRFAVTFALDQNGLLTVTVHHVNTDRKYVAEIKQNTAVGGVDALAAMRNKLLRMYVGVVASKPDEPPPPPVVAPVGAAAQPAPGAPQPAAGQTGSAAPQAAGAAGQAAPPGGAPAGTQPAPQPAAGTTPPQAGTPEGVLPKPVEVPAELKRLVRKAAKQLEKAHDPKLAAAYNALVAALNAKQTEEEIEDLADELEDVTNDARQRTP